MSNKVKLKKVTADNWEAVVEPELRGSQEDLVASNLYSVAEAQFDPDARPRAVYAGKRGAEQGSGRDPSDPGVNRISIRYTPKNPVAKPFYASFGFVEVGRDRDGEVIAVLKL